MPQTLQFKITLKNSEPKIWRRFVVEDHITCDDLHLVIQHVMGWTNIHLYQFVYDNNSFIGTPEIIDADDVVDAKIVPLHDFFNKTGMEIDYEYDLGDTWYHELVLEKISSPLIGKQYPECIEGECACPPEDCGGIYGYRRILDIVKNEKHIDHTETVLRLGAFFDPNEFNIPEVNEKLRKLYKD